MPYVKPKKHLGQHFLNDENIAAKITESISTPCNALLEIGPGTGVLTKYLLKSDIAQFKAFDVDTDSIKYLKEKYPADADKFIEADFLNARLSDYFEGCFTIIGNFPYNISSQIFFKVLEDYDKVPEIVCMLQKEVAERLAAGPGSKTYGILSVLLQTWYDIEYLFTVSEQVFIPPPKVKSAVIRLKRNKVTDLGCDPVLFKKLVKTAFNQRRKTLRNAIKSLNPVLSDEVRLMLDKRAEQLSVHDFVILTNNLKPL